jgi:hypothetical protein
MLLPAVDTKDADDGIFLVVTCHTFFFLAPENNACCVVAVHIYA